VRGLAERSITGVEVADRAIIASRRVYSLSVRRCTMLLLRIVGAFIVQTPAIALAQAPTEPMRLNVRPQEMATGTRNAQAGLQSLDSLNDVDSVSDALVYVPKRSVGTQRVPLVVLLHGAGMNSSDMIDVDDRIFQTLADSLGFILLALRSYQEGIWPYVRLIQVPDSFKGPDSTSRTEDVHRVGAAIRQVLRHYAIDPSRIALAGVSNGGGYTFALGYVNGDVFSRIIAWSPGAGMLENLDQYFRSYPRHGKSPLFVAQGNNDEEVPVTRTRAVVELLRKLGDSVTYVEDTGMHYLTPERAIAAFNWLAKDWK
jgi:phospholipase/carboxylesterase